MIRRRKKPRDWAADVVRGDVTIDDVPPQLQHWIEWYIGAVAQQVAAERRRKAVKE